MGSPVPQHRPAPQKPATRRLTRGDAEQIAHTLRAVADPTRLQLLSMIIDSRSGEALVGELADELNLSQPTVSHHMRIMFEDGLLAKEQRGRQVWYSVSPERLPDIVDLLR